MEAAYLRSLDEDEDEVVSELERVAELHPGERLVLLCYENTWRGDPCHRTWAATWLKEHLGLEVPELGPAHSVMVYKSKLAPRR